MKKLSIIPALLCLVNLPAFSQRTEMRQLPAFQKIEIKSYATVYLRQDSVQSVKVTTEGSTADVVTRVNNNTLVIDGSGHGELYVTAPSVTGIRIGGEGEVIGQSAVETSSLDLDVSGNGKMVLQMQVKDLNAAISGVGKMTLSGTAQQASFDISGSGKVEALDLKVHDGHIAISGNGKCLVDVSENLVTDISGNGSVRYRETPKNITQNITGAGRVSRYPDDSSSSTGDTTRLTFGKSQVIIIGDVNARNLHRKKMAKPIWAGFEMGFNNYVNSSFNFDLPADYSFLELRDNKSVSVGLNLLQKNVELGHSNVWFFTGLGFTWNNYHFARNVTLYPTSPITGSFDTTSSVYHIKSKLTVSYLMVPLMIEAFTSRDPKKAFHIGAGGMVGLRLGAHTKQKSELDGNTFKPKVFDEFGLNWLRAGARVAIGIHRLNLYAEYYFSPLFSSGEGPKMYPVNIGITLLGF